jgi:hypothetical protein
MRTLRTIRHARQTRRLRSRVARAFAQAVFFIVAFGLVIALLTWFGRPAVTRAAEAESSLNATRVSELSQRYDCSRTGFGPDVIPAHAIVLTPGSRVQLTSFDRGWTILEGKRPGTLLAVCRR